MSMLWIYGEFHTDSFAAKCKLIFWRLERHKCDLDKIKLHQMWYSVLFLQEFLERTAYPLLEGSASFLLSWLIEGQEGYLETNPSTSPEHYFIAPDGMKASVSYSTTMDMSIIREVFSAVLLSADVSLHFYLLLLKETGFIEYADTLVILWMKHADLKRYSRVIVKSCHSSMYLFECLCVWSIHTCVIRF